jgi:hypothetical protein
MNLETVRSGIFVIVRHELGYQCIRNAVLNISCSSIEDYYFGSLTFNEAKTESESLNEKKHGRRLT